MFPYPGIILAGSLLAAPLLSQSAEMEPVRMSSAAFGVSAEIEVRNLSAAAASVAIEAALQEVFVLGRLTDPDGNEPGGLGTLNRAAGEGPQAIDLRLAEVILRSLQFCIWSGGAYGPLGGDLNQMWNELRAKNHRPALSDLRRAVGSAECSRLSLRSNEADGAVRPTTATAELEDGSRVDLRGIARGYAVDRAAGVLQSHGADNFWIEIGNVWSARGRGPEGYGWLATVPSSPEGEEEPLDQIWLRNQALAVLSVDPLLGEAHVPLIDQRSGVPSSGVMTVIAVTDLAVDVEPLVAGLFILGHRGGHMRLGALKPRPSVLWLLGKGTGTPLESTYRWSELERVRRSQ